MKVMHGNGATKYGPGVSIELTGNDVAMAVDAYLTAKGIYITGPRTIRVNGPGVSIELTGNDVAMAVDASAVVKRKDWL